MLTTEISHIQNEMDRSIRDIEYICQLIDNYKLNNEQFYLEWLDRLNELSVRN